MVYSTHPAGSLLRPAFGPVLRSAMALLLAGMLSACTDDSRRITNATGSVGPSPNPTTTPSASPSATPTLSPSPSASASPQATATPQASASPTPSASPQATPSASPAAPREMPLVTVADLCDVSVPGTLAPLCEELGKASADLVSQCDSASASAACQTLDGNLYALVHACYRDGAALFGEQTRSFCKIADTLVSGAAAYCRQLPGTPPELCSLMSEGLIADAVIQEYQDSVLHTAHRLQRELAADLPLRHTLYVSTHNSFNATDANTPPSLSGSDANQRYVIVDQLRMDVRGLEIDVHWMPSLLDGGFQPTVCHGNVQHLGCTYERSFREELVELRSWLDENPQEVVVLGLETRFSEPFDDYLGSGKYAAASADIEATVGERLFRPGLDTAHTCEQGQPLETSIAEVRAAGKQLIIYGDCNYGNDGANLVFGTDGTHTQRGGGSYIGIQAPDACGFSLSDLETKWVRYYEDGTLVGALSGVDRQANVDEVTQMARCNINMPSLDHLLPFDGRMQALIWSWDVGEPASLAGALRAVHNADGRFQAVSLDSAPAIKACANPQQTVVVDDALNPLRWRIADTCEAPYTWATPRHGLDNEALKQAKLQAGVSDVSLSLHRPEQGQWSAD